MNSKLTIYSSLAFIIVIVLAFTIKRENKFPVSVEAIHEQVISEQHIANEALLNQLIERNEEFLIIDLRTPDDYNLGHITNAKNFPLKNLLNKEFLSEIESSSKPVVLYGTYSCDAQRAFMMLSQLGFEKISIIAGGYQYYKEFPDYKFPVESAKYDFKKVMEEKTGGEFIAPNPEATMNIVIPTRTKQKRAEGGC